MSSPVNSVHLTGVLCILDKLQEFVHQGKRTLTELPEQDSESFIQKHQLIKHQGAQAKVIESYKDCLSRQISKGVNIRRSEAEVLN